MDGLVRLAYGSAFPQSACLQLFTIAGKMLRKKKVRSNVKNTAVGPIMSKKHLQHRLFDFLCTCYQAAAHFAGFHDIICISWDRATMALNSSCEPGRRLSQASQTASAPSSSLFLRCLLFFSPDSSPTAASSSVSLCLWCLCLCLRSCNTSQSCSATEAWISHKNQLTARRMVAALSNPR